MNKLLKLVVAVSLLAVGLGAVEGAVPYRITGVPDSFKAATSVLNVGAFDDSTRTAQEHFVTWDALEDVMAYYEPRQVIFDPTATAASITAWSAERGDNVFPLDVSFEGCRWLTDAYLQAFVVGTNGMIVKLNLRNTGVTDISALANCRGLKTLDLRGCTGVTDISPLAGCPGLQYLYLRGCIGVRDIMPLAGCTRLERLILSGTGVTDISVLEHCTGLQTLNLSGCTNVINIMPLANCTGLQTLFLIGCRNVINIMPLARCPGLKYLDLDGCIGVTDTDIDELQRSLPRLRIYR